MGGCWGILGVEAGVLCWERCVAVQYRQVIFKNSCVRIVCAAMSPWTTLHYSSVVDISAANEWS